MAGSGKHLMLIHVVMECWIPSTHILSESDPQHQFLELAPLLRYQEAIIGGKVTEHDAKNVLNNAES